MWFICTQYLFSGKVGETQLEKTLLCGAKQNMLCTLRTLRLLELDCQQLDMLVIRVIMMCGWLSLVSLIRA